MLLMIAYLDIAIAVRFCKVSCMREDIWRIIADLFDKIKI